MYTVNKQVDYFSFTMPMTDSLNQISVDFSEIESERYGGNAYGYNLTRRYQRGLVTMCHTERPQMGLHCIYSAKALNQLEHGIIELMQSVLDNGYKVSRVDLAITSKREDGENHELTPHKIAELALEGKVTTKLKNGVQIGENLRVQTAYFGSLKTRKRLFRAYDKGLESGHVEDFLIRYELETRQNATQLAKAVCNNGDIGALVNNYISIDNPVWSQIVGTQSTKPDYAQDEKTLNETLWQWLIESAAPALGRAMAQSKTPELASGNMQLFNDGMLRSYKKHKNNE